MAITINKRTIKAAAGAGMKGPDGPILDLAPGKYKFSIKLAGKPASNDELEVGADETWGLRRPSRRALDARVLMSGMVATFNRGLSLAVRRRPRDELARAAHENALIVARDLVTTAEKSQRALELRRSFG